MGVSSGQKIASPASLAPRHRPVCNGLFDIFKESDETKAAKEAEWEAIQAKAKMRRDPVAWEAEINKRRIKEAEMRAAQAQQELSEPGEALQQNLPEGWASAVDSTSGDTYYYNKAKGLNQWQRPTE